MTHVYLALGIVDEMFDNMCEQSSIVRLPLDASEAKTIIDRNRDRIMSCLKQADIPKLKAIMGDFFDCRFPTCHDKLELNEGDSILVIRLRNLPEVPVNGRRYTACETAALRVQYTLWTIQ